MQQAKTFRFDHGVQVADPGDVVTLPPGRLRLATRPSATGSPRNTEPMGMMRVADIAARAVRAAAVLRYAGSDRSRKRPPCSEERC